MDVMQTLKEIEDTCNKYNFWEEKVTPYGYGITIQKLFDGWNDYDRCTSGSRSVIRSEIRGFLPILAKWVEYENEPIVSVKITTGENIGQIKEYHKSTADMLIEGGMAIAI